MRKNNTAALPIIAIIVAVVLVMATIGIYYVAFVAGYGSGDDYIPTMEMTLSAKANGNIYDADIVMDVDNAQFIDYFFYSASAASDPGFPAGDNVLVITIYDEAITNNMPDESILFKETYKVGNLYGYQQAGIQETTWTIKLPMLKDIAQDDKGASYLHILVEFDGSEIGRAIVCCNPEAA